MTVDELIIKLQALPAEVRALPVCVVGTESVETYECENITVFDGDRYTVSFSGGAYRHFHQVELS